MSNTSATGGYIQPTADIININHLIHDFIMGLTGIDKTLIRPMYQPNAPTIPAFGTDWIAYNVRESDSDNYSSQILNTDYELKRLAQLIVTISFYGSNSYTKIKQFKDALELTQNWEVMRQSGLMLSGSGNIIKVPELHNMRWLDRYNIEIAINQMTIKTAPIISLEKVSTTVAVNDTLIVNR